MAENGSGEELKQLILSVTGQMPEGDKLKAILSSFQDLADKLAYEKEGLASLSAPVIG